MFVLKDGEDFHIFTLNYGDIDKGEELIYYPEIEIEELYVLNDDEIREFLKIMNENGRDVIVTFTDEDYEDHTINLICRKCACGAYTIEIDGNDYCFGSLEIVKEELGEDIASILHVSSPEFGNCNYCVNNWGVDLCGCGSGEEFGKCKEGYKACERPAQDWRKGINHCYLDEPMWPMQRKPE